MRAGMEPLATQRIRTLKTAAGLEGVVRFYTQREAPVPHADHVYPVPARAAPILEFILADPFEIHWCERPLVETTPSAVLIGLQTHRRVRLVTKRRLETFCIVFQPAGVFRLFGLPCAELTNHDYDARAVFGPVVNELHEQLGACRSFEERARVGTIYAKESPFRAKRIGAALVARNIALHIEQRFAEKARDWRPLIYCWRGGQRSTAMTIVLRQAGMACSRGSSTCERTGRSRA